MRKKSRLATRRAPRRQLRLGKWFLLSMLFVSAILVIGFFITPSIWDREGRLTVVSSSQEGKVSVLIFDPSAGKVITIPIPSETEVDVARQLGEWKIGSVPKLAVQEKIPSLVAETVTKSLKISVDAWADERLSYLGETQSLRALGAVFSISSTNLSLKDRVYLAVFSMGRGQRDRLSYDLTEMGYIVAAKLSDGSRGFRVRETVPSRLLAVFGDSRVASEGVPVTITDVGSGRQKASEIGEIIEVLGAKVFAIKQAKAEEFVCRVEGKKSVSGERIARTFNCVYAPGEGEGVELLLGKAFVGRF